MKKISLLIFALFAALVTLTSCTKDQENKVELPTISTLAVDEITATSAKSGGDVTNNGGADITSKGIIWGTSHNPSFEQHSGLTVEGAGAGLFQSALTGLTQNTTYYVKAYATNSAGAAYGSLVQFTTETAGSAPEAAFTATPTSGAAPLTVSFTDQSLNFPTSWTWDFGDGNSSNQQNPSHTYQNSGNYNLSLTLSNSLGTDTETKTNYIIVFPDGVDSNDVYNPVTGKIWMDRNLGASRVAQSSTDAEAYGDLYQWGRLTDGHEKRTSGTTSTLSSSDVPGHGNFITVVSVPHDWRSPQNESLWQGINGDNTPCPAGYRLPTREEWIAESSSWNSDNAEGAFSSPLKLPYAGLRNRVDGSFEDDGGVGFYWSESVYGSLSWILLFSSNNIYTHYESHANGFSVRCIKD